MSAQTPGARVGCRVAWLVAFSVSERIHSQEFPPVCQAVHIAGLAKIRRRVHVTRDQNNRIDAGDCLVPRSDGRKRFSDSFQLTIRYVGPGRA